MMFKGEKKICYENMQNLLLTSVAAGSCSTLILVKPIKKFHSVIYYLADTERLSLQRCYVITLC